MNDSLQKILNLGSDIEYEGKTYSIPAADIVQEGRFGTWVEKRAWQALERSAVNGEWTEERARAASSSLLGDIAAGKYDWGGEYCVAALQSLAGQAAILHIVLGQTHPEVTEEFAKKLAQAKAMQIGKWVEEQLSDSKSFAGLVDLLGFPKSSNGSPPTKKHRSRSKR